MSIYSKTQTLFIILSSLTTLKKKTNIVFSSMRWFSNYSNTSNKKTGHDPVKATQILVFNNFFVYFDLDLDTQIFLKNFLHLTIENTQTPKKDSQVKNI